MNTLVAMTKEKTPTVADLVHECLVRTGLTDAELGDLIGVHQSQISRWKRGAGVPRESYVTALAEVLDLPDDVVEDARVEGERLRVELAARREKDPKEELRRMKKELRAAQAKAKRLEEKLRRYE